MMVGCFFLATSDVVDTLLAPEAASKESRKDEEGRGGKCTSTHNSYGYLLVQQAKIRPRLS